VQLSGPGREAFALAADDAFEVQLVHESGDAVATNARALTIELVPDLLDPVDAEVVAVDAADFEFEALIVLVASRQRTPYRGVVGGWGNLQDPADRLDSPAVAVSADEPHDFFGSRGSSSAAKKAGAAFRISSARRG